MSIEVEFQEIMHWLSNDVKNTFGQPQRSTLMKVEGQTLRTLESKISKTVED